MDPCLSELLVGRSVLRAWLAELGVTSCSDVRWLWSDANQCMCELESVTGVSREDILYMQDLYLTCAARAALEQGTAVRSIVASCMPGRRDVCMWKPQLAETPAKRAKVLIPWRHSDQAVVPDMHSVRPRAGTPAAQKKLRELFLLAAEHFLDFRALGLAPVNWQDEESIAAAERLVMSSASTCSAGHLSQVTSCLRRWIKAAAENQHSISNASPAQLAAFLHKVSFGGPTAASGVFSALAWCNKHLGAMFPLDHFLTRP